MFDWILSLANNIIVLSVVTLGIDGTTSRSLFEGDSIDVCVSKDTVTARVVNFLLTTLPGSAGRMCYPFINIRPLH